MTKFPYMSVAYVASIVVVNVIFALHLGVGPVDLGSFVVGATFVLRDYAQRELGHGVLLAMVLAAILSFLLADPFVAVASVLAFGISELADWAIYTWSKKPFGQRVLLSSLISAPVDSVVFLWWIQSLDALSVAIMIASKLVAALIIWRLHMRDQYEPA